jgi:hypothetical protein
MNLSQPPKKTPAWANRADVDEASFHHEENGEGVTMRTRDLEAVAIVAAREILVASTRRAW